MAPKKALVPAKKKVAGKGVAQKAAKASKPSTPSKAPAAVVKPPKHTRMNQQQSLMTPSEERFVQEYLIDLNGTRACMAAFPALKITSARVQACRLLVKPNLVAAIAKAKAARSAKTGITADEALEHVWGIATADVRELVEHVIGCCRHCYGEGFGYQRTAREFQIADAANAQANEKAIDDGKPIKDFDPMGGIGYDKRRAPSLDCPECFGEGVGRTLFKDTRNLSPGAAALYAGVKETKDGLEVKVHSKVDALEKVFKHLGLYERDNKQRGLLDGVSRETLKAVAERLRGG